MLSLSCPAKINLYLEIRGKRADGFHELGTLFQAISAGDMLRAEPWDELALVGGNDVTTTPEDNLVLKAAHLVKKRYEDRITTPSGIRFHLTKNLPAGAGLGGGSSDAAAALRLADALWGTRLTTGELQSLGAELGSDVPFFLSSTTAYGEGRGEKLAQAPSPYPFHVVIATPPCHVNTAWAYGELARRRAELGDGLWGKTWDAFRSAYATGSQNPDFYTRLRNDFEEPVMAQYPEIRTIRDALEGFNPVKSLLSGSGASVFALFKSDTEAKKAAATIQPLCRFSGVTQFLTDPPFFESSEAFST